MTARRPPVHDLGGVSADQLRAAMDHLCADRRSNVQRITGVDLSHCRTMKDEIDALANDPTIKHLFKQAMR